VSSLEWEVVNMSQEEEDLVSRMHKLVGDRFDLLTNNEYYFVGK